MAQVFFLSKGKHKKYCHVMVVLT